MQRVVKPVVKPVEQPAVQLYSRLDKRLHRVNTHSTGCQIGCETLWQPVGCLFTRCSRLSNRFYNRFDNRLYRV